MARITVAAPVTASPPAKTPGRVVAPESSATRQPRRVVSSPCVVLEISGFGDVPRAMMTVSVGISNSEPGMGTGLRRPLSSGSPSSIRMHFRARTQPFSSPSTSTGLVSMSKMMPSCMAWWTSSRRAGSSASVRRYTMWTSAPRRSAVRAASMATLPPPTTHTFLPAWIGVR